MGSLKGKKKIHVASTTYNLAGPEDDRNNFLKTTILGIMTSPRDLYVGENLVRTYLNGPGITFRNFARWANSSGYTKDVIKQTGGTITLPATVNHNIIAQYINPFVPSRVMITLAELGIAEYNYWAMDYILKNFPHLIEGNWASYFDDDTDQVVIEFYDAAGEVESEARFTAYGFVKDARYVYATYMHAQDASEGVLEEGDYIVHGSDPLPSTEGWTNLSTSSSEVTYQIPTTIVTEISYSDETPPEETTETIPETETRDDVNSVWERTTYLGSSGEPGDSIGSLHEYLHLFASYQVESSTSTTTSQEVVDEVTITTTVTTTTRYLVPSNTSRLDTRKDTLAGWSAPQMLMYREGSGSAAMDSQFEAPVSMGEFFPFIPVRLWERFVSDTYNPSLYTNGKKALKKSTGAELDKIIETLGENPSIGDIDHAFIVYGVSLNAKDKSSRRYLYTFFQQLLEAHTGFEYNAWENTFLEAKEKQAIWREWRMAQINPESPLFNTPEPEYIEIPYAPAMSIRLRSEYVGIDYDMTISWSSISETMGSGVFKPGAKRGDIDVTLGTQLNDDLILYQGFGNNQFLTVDWRDSVHITWQHERDAYRRLTIRGLNHRNIVYKGKSVSISARQALTDTEESGFIVPLHAQLYRSTPLVHSTQMSQACAYIVLNSWEVTKQKWYQTGAFKIILIVVVIVVTVISGGAGAGGAGILGTNASVGATIGFTGTAALVAGAIANAVAAIVVAQVITAGATALFGEKWGTIIGIIASMVVINMGTNAATGNGWAVDYNQLTKADNLLKLTDAIGKGVSADIQHKAMKKFEETEAIIADYEEQSKRIAELYQKNIGEGSGVDILAIQELASKFDFNQEAPTDFLSRTLMTGTDIAELSQTLINDFANISTSLNLS